MCPWTPVENPPNISLKGHAELERRPHLGWVSSARMLQLRPGQCATGHDGGVGGQPRRIDASAPIAAPHRCVSPSRRGTRSALGFAQTCRAVTAGYDRRMRYVCCMPAGHITASAPIATPSRRGTRSALRCAQTCRAVSRVRPACCMPAGHARAHTHDVCVCVFVRVQYI